LCAYQAKIWNKKVTAIVLRNKHIKIIDLNKKHYCKEICNLMILEDEIKRDRTYTNRVRELCTKNRKFFDGLIFLNVIKTKF